MTRKYPDVSAILTAKVERRRRLARLPIEEKIEIVNKWRQLSMQIQKVRQAGQISRTKKVEDAK